MPNEAADRAADRESRENTGYKLNALAIHLQTLQEAVDKIDRKLDRLAVESRLAVIEDRLKLVYGVLGALGLGLISLTVWMLTEGRP